MFNRATLVILFVALALGLGLWSLQGRKAGQGPALQAVQLLPQPRALPDFSLRQSDETPLVPGELKGHWTVVFLGFTHCPDVCPTTLAQLARAQRQWATLPESSRPRLLFVSVDPERDSPDRVGEYAHGFDRDTLAATADLPQLQSLARALSMSFDKVETEGVAPGNYTIEHSASLAVLDPQARMAGVIVPAHDPSQRPFDVDAIAADLLRLTRTRPR